MLRCLTETVESESLLEFQDKKSHKIQAMSNESLQIATALIYNEIVSTFV